MTILKKLTEQIKWAYFVDVVKNSTFRRNKLSPGELVQTMDYFIRTQNVNPNNQVLLTSLKLSTEHIDRYNPDHARHLIHLTPRQKEAYERKNMIMTGAAGTGKTALIKAKVIKLVESKSGEKIVIVPSADYNRSNFENHNDNVQIWTPQYLRDQFKLGDIVKDLGELLYEWKQRTKEYKVRLDESDEIDDLEEQRRVFENVSGVKIILEKWEF